jgi:hypothetical protein
MNKLLPWILGGAAALLVIVASSSSKATPTPTPTPPLPTPPPPPPPPQPPAPNPAQAFLLAQLQMLLQQAAANPNAVDPAQLETLAYQLDAAGLPQQAAQARALAAQIRLARGGGTPPVPNPQPPSTDVLLAQYTALLQQAMTNPTQTDPVLLDQLAIQLDAAGMGYQATILRAAAADVRKKRSQNMVAPY